MRTRAMIVKEFHQLRRDRRTLALIIALPLMLLVVLGYAASFDVSEIPTLVVGPQAGVIQSRLAQPFAPVRVETGWGSEEAQRELRDGRAQVAWVTGGPRLLVLVDGTELFAARAALEAVARLGAGNATSLSAAGVAAPEVRVLYNPDLKTSLIMVPGLAGVILVVVGTLITSLGIVRERQTGMLEQLAVMPLSPWDVFAGKIAPYFLIAVLDLAMVLGAGMLLFGVPLRGSAAVLALGALLFLFVTLSLGVLISSVSQNQGQAIQLAILAVLPQILLSGLVFPLPAMAASVRWIAYLLPLTYFIRIARAVMLKGTPIGALAQPFLYLALLGAAAVILATLRFRQLLEPAAGRGRRPAVARAGAGESP